MSDKSASLAVIAIMLLLTGNAGTVAGKTGHNINSDLLLAIPVVSSLALIIPILCSICSSCTVLGVHCDRCRVIPQIK